MDAKAKAQEMLTKVGDGQTLFTKAANGTWMIVGPTANMVPGVIVTVTKADGTSREVIVGTLGYTGTIQGTSYTVAEFTKTQTEMAAGRTGRGGYRTVHSSVYGEGRVYHDQPGATQYDSGDGRYSTQIWDNS